MKQTISTLLILFSLFYLTISSSAADGRMRNPEKEKHNDFYEKISLTGPSYESFNYGLNGYQRICDSLHTNFRYLCVVDFIKPSSEKRLYVIDMQDTSIFHSDYVSHGRNSGELYAESFSNEMHSYQSSLGFYLISETYDGKHGLSIRLDGLDRGFNDKARDRAVVMHAAEYADPSFITLNGRLGRSQGCPALPAEGFNKVAPFIQGKSVLFIYYPKEDYLSHSVWLNKQSRIAALPANQETADVIMPAK